MFLVPLFFTLGGDNSRRTWFFDVTVTSCPPTLSNCQRWILNNSTEGFEHDTCSVDYCPPSEDFALASGWPCLRNDPGFATRTCYRPWRRVYSSTGSFGNRDLGVAQSVCIFMSGLGITLFTTPILGLRKDNNFTAVCLFTEVPTYNLTNFSWIRH